MVMLENYEQVAHIVELLYSSRDPSQVHEHQKYLHEVQKSPEGYEVGLYLLSRDSTTCKYFGALTLTVVLQSTAFDATQCHRLISDSFTHVKVIIEDATSTSQNLMVVRKLMSTISLAYLKYHDTFKNPILSFAQILAPEITSEGDISHFATLMTRLSSTQLTILLIFFSVLIEDVSKANDLQSGLHAAVRENLYPLLLIVYQYLYHVQCQQQLSYELDLQSLQTLNSWMAYLPNVNGDSRYEDLDDLVKYLSSHFPITINADDTDSLELITQTLITFNEILELNANSLSHEQKQTLYATVLGDWGISFVDQVVLVEDDHFEVTSAYIDLILTVLQLNSIRLSKSLLEPNTQAILNLAVRLTSARGTPIVDESISERMLLFWEELASVYEDSSDVFDTLFEAQNDPHYQASFQAEQRRIFDTVARIYWRKLHLPDSQIYTQIRTEWNAYRSNVAELFLVVYSLLKAEFYQRMQQSLIQKSQQDAITPDAWLDLEATMFILYRINDDTVYFESQANQLAPFAHTLFETGFLTKFVSLSVEETLQATIYATLIQFCSSNVFYFKTAEGSKHLGEVFNVVFPLLLNGENTTLALLASKTTLKLCEECSDHLVNFLQDLEEVVVSMLNNHGADSLIRSRMFNAYSVIARCIHDVDEHSKIIYNVVSAIANAASLVVQSLNPTVCLSSDHEEYLGSLLSCLVNVAKGSSLSDEVIEEMSEQEKKDYSVFWLADPYNIKQMVMSVVQEFSIANRTLSQNTIFVEKCTLILKAGLGERLGGGFDVGNEQIISFVMDYMEKTSNANAVPYVFGLMECLVSVEFQRIDSDSMEHLVQRAFTQKLDFLKTDPDMVKSAIDFFSKILECRPSLILYTEFFQSIVLSFALEGLAANEMFVVKSISRFWTSFLNMRRGSSADHEESQRIVESLNLVEVITSSLVTAFIQTARSNLESYYAIFRSLIGKVPVQFKNSLTNSMRDPILMQEMGPKAIELFIHKLMVTRGRRTANEVLKHFWLAANGLVEYNSQATQLID